MSQFFSRKNFWIFDLDNTLYPASTRIFNMIDQRMKSFISMKLNISPEEAFTLQKDFYKNYGTTLSGLMKFYNVDPDQFLDYVHNIDFSKIKRSEKLRQSINRLQGKKILYTNGDMKYAKKVLKAIGIDKSIPNIFDIKKANFIPKPELISYKKMIKEFEIDPEKAVFFEDIEKNLEPAYKLGITTVHIDIEHDDKSNEKLKSFINFKFKYIESAITEILK